MSEQEAVKFAKLMDGMNGKQLAYVIAYAMQRITEVAKITDFIEPTKERKAPPMYDARNQD